jgi:glycosyltransferase involved in cell wall biosynthesis
MSLFEARESTARAASRTTRRASRENARAPPYASPVPAPRPKIAHVDAETGFSGGEKQVFLLIEGLRREGWGNVLVSPEGSRSRARAAELGIEHVAVAMRNDLDGPSVLALRRAFERGGAALAHLHTGRATWLGGWAARMAGIPAITTRRMDRDVRPGARARLVHGTLTRRSVAISPGVAECLRRGGVPEERIRTIWSAVDVEELRPSRPRDAVRAELGSPPDRVVVLALGALVPRKGIDVLLDALAGLRGGATPWVAWIAGSGDERTALERRAESLELGSRVRFLGQRDDAADLLGACDLLAMPSRREGLGVAALEAMAAGRPVVASRVGGLGQAVVDRSTGLLVPPDDPRALAAALLELIESPELRARLGVQARARVDAEFRAERMVSAYAALYREVLAEAGR